MMTNQTKLRIGMVGSIMVVVSLMTGVLFYHGDTEVAMVMVGILIMFTTVIRWLKEADHKESPIVIQEATEETANDISVPSIMIDEGCELVDVDTIEKIADEVIKYADDIHGVLSVHIEDLLRDWGTGLLHAIGKKRYPK